MRLLLLLTLSLIFLTACNNEESAPEPTATEVVGLLGAIPTLAPPSPTLTPTAIVIDETLLPIAPDPTGRMLYLENCAGCHGVNGEGQFPEDPYSPDAQGLVGAPPHDSTGHTWHHPDQTLILLITTGRSQPGAYPMPPFGQKLSQEDIISILAYIKTLWGTEELASQFTTTQSYQP